MQTKPVHSIKEFFNQRIRWASKADLYEDKRIFAALLLVYLVNVMLFVLPVIAVFKNMQFTIINFQISTWELFFYMLLLKTIIELIFLYRVASFFSNRKLLLFFPLLQPFHILYIIIAGWLGKFGKYSWKGRSVK